MGAMLMKIVILRRENESHNTTHLKKCGRNINNFHDFFMGAMLIQIVILLRGNESHITKNFKNCEKNVY